MTYHFIVGDMAAQPLKTALQEDDEVIVIKDLLHIGPLAKEEGQSFSALRTTFWQEIAPNEKSPIVLNDMERLLEISAAMYKDESIQAWFWMAPWPADICAYYWLLPYLSKHLGRFHIVNIAGLPFLDEQGKLYYPKNISEIAPRELVKAKKLARQITPSEMEVDTDEWKKLVDENMDLRVHEGGKKIISKTEDFYDAQLLSFCSQQYQKASKIIRQALGKYPIPTGDIFLTYRLRELIKNGQLKANGNIEKAANEFDICLPNDENKTTTEPEIFA